MKNKENYQKLVYRMKIANYYKQNLKKIVNYLNILNIGNKELFING